MNDGTTDAISDATSAPSLLILATNDALPDAVPLPLVA
jgi:hypothetical protein